MPRPDAYRLAPMLLLAASAALYGLRHGIDWDHLAAITDITSGQVTPGRSLRVASAYAVGHAVVVFALGVLAVVGAPLLPDGIDAVMGRVVGVTLLLLAA